MIAEVKLSGRTIGAVRLDADRDVASFQYDSEFVRSGIELSPLVMPLRSSVYEFPSLSRATFRGLPGLLAVVDEERESELSWTALLLDLNQRGLASPSLAIGDGALGFWAAVGKAFPATKHQGCTVHALRNALDKLPKKLHDHAKALLHEMFNAPTEREALKQFDVFKQTFNDKYPKAVETIEKRRAKLLAFYSFPAAHWKSIRSTNVIESTFATIRRRTNLTNGHGSRDATLAMMFVLADNASKTWRKIDGFNHIANVLNGLPFVDGELKMAA